ncbi:EVE domain-containing protein [Desulfobotulus sp. H1]|uniref:EVE domain-containing protein n=1 Tax=Desulfobotulus pelophilus TaxID=2823377 RepID=A0ABT3N6K6_9BACT|nr:EVE domain-containing protein [Desulfobotulus pelophilus]MCW7753093.1 EVE domain-containing protein [Desulfobotulus pelophilus]
MAQNYWILKSEPSVFSIEDLASRPDQTEGWDGVRNYQARNYLKDGMNKGDAILYYHSSIKEPAIVGLCSVVREAYPDTSAWNPDSAYHDPKSIPEKPIWFQVDIQLKEIFTYPVYLRDLKKNPLFQDMILLKRGNRLSVLPASATHFHAILKMAGIKNKR